MKEVAILFDERSPFWVCGDMRVNVRFAEQKLNYLRHAINLRGWMTVHEIREYFLDRRSNEPSLTELIYGVKNNFEASVEYMTEDVFPASFVLITFEVEPLIDLDELKTEDTDESV